MSYLTLDFTQGENITSSLGVNLTFGFATQSIATGSLWTRTRFRFNNRYNFTGVGNSSYIELLTISSSATESLSLQVREDAGTTDVVLVITDSTGSVSYTSLVTASWIFSARQQTAVIHWWDISPATSSIQVWVGPNDDYTWTDVFQVYSSSLHRTPAGGLTASSITVGAPGIRYEAGTTTTYARSHSFDLMSFDVVSGLLHADPYGTEFVHVYSSSMAIIEEAFPYYNKQHFVGTVYTSINNPVIVKTGYLSVTDFDYLATSNSLYRMGVNPLVVPAYYALGPMSVLSNNIIISPVSNSLQTSMSVSFSFGLTDMSGSRYGLILNGYTGSPHISLMPIPGDPDYKVIGDVWYNSSGSGRYNGLRYAEYSLSGTVEPRPIGTVLFTSRSLSALSDEEMVEGTIYVQSGSSTMYLRMSGSWFSFATGSVVDGGTY